LNGDPEIPCEIHSNRVKASVKILGTHMAFDTSTDEGFKQFLIEKIGEIHTASAAMEGNLKAAIVRHDALKDRVASIELAARSATHWENGKFVALAAAHAVANIFKVHI
jgi:hypothetical protein